MGTTAHTANERPTCFCCHQPITGVVLRYQWFGNIFADFCSVECKERFEVRSPRVLPKH